MSAPGSLAGLPGSSADPGTGPCVGVLFDGLLDDTGSLPAHREQRAGGHGDLVGPLLVPATGAEEFAAGLGSADGGPADIGLRVLLVGAGAPEQALPALAAARGRFLADSRVDIVGVRVPVPPAPEARAALADLLAGLAFAVPAWLELGPVPGWEDALEVLAGDGAEHLCLLPGGAAETAAMLRRAVDLNLTMRLGGRPAAVLSGSPDTPDVVRGVGILNALCAVRAALNGADEPQLAAVLAETRPQPLVSALRRMSAADAAVTRAFLAGVPVAAVGAVAAELVRLDLLTAEG